MISDTSNKEHAYAIIETRLAELKIWSHEAETQSIIQTTSYNYIFMEKNSRIVYTVPKITIYQAHLLNEILIFIMSA